MRSPNCKFCKVVDAPTGTRSVLHCCPCDEFFIKSESYKKHDSLKHKGKVSSLPSAPFTCLDCQKDFYDESLFQGHLARHGVARREAEQAARHGHEPSRPKKKLFFCPHCNRDFTHARDRDHHISICPDLHRCLDSNCLKRFRTLAGLISHLESGACGGGYTRDKINLFICGRDRTGEITLPGAFDLAKKGRKINAASEANRFDLEDKLAALSISSSGSGILTPDSDGSEIGFETPPNGRLLELEEILSVSSDDSDLTLTSLAARLSELVPSQDEDISSSHHECEICHKTFFSKIGLRQHLESPTHSPHLYHCGLPFLQRDSDSIQSHRARRKFKTLSGLVAHIEVGACGGDATLSAAIAMLGRLASEFGFPEMTKVAKRIGGKFAALE
ncbi:hypothetical protein TWF730_001474 [Orbilia blumenaviensis]|uniref:C2H2-type domain-containing protein n=1 Tax=Orbilia blumenaviensis TaxID=1796055 RepID=A0AAV9UHR5_9PEZI